MPRRRPLRSRRGSPARGPRSARTIPALAAEDALRVFGADEVLVAGDDGMFEAIRERVALPVSRAVAPTRYLPAEEETYCATAWIWAGLSFPWNAGIAPPPTIT